MAYPAPLEAEAAVDFLQEAEEVEVEVEVADYPEEAARDSQSRLFVA